MLLNSEPDEINLSMNSHIHEWILDSGASFYVTSNKFWFDHLYESDHGNVVVWGEVAYRITGVGNVTVKFDSGFVHTLREVRYVPHMGRNLISIGELESTRLQAHHDTRRQHLSHIMARLQTHHGTRRQQLRHNVGTRRQQLRHKDLNMD
ncbi:CCHC-type domain-containing protein [Abeliophyllum distichum]|uniref:CCHC-type domain-containing protein n=1 Tax=Abeliophyllum distichum TaxID=126358 RepID=A0ABD1V3P5_9LAMI